MNIRQHLLSAINSGLPAQFTVQAAVPGARGLSRKYGKETAERIIEKHTGRKVNLQH